MSANQLFKEFPQISAEQWMRQVIKDLKGESFEEKLTYRSADGILVKPFYTQEDLAKYSERKPLFTHTDWEICVEIDGTSESSGNKKALHALNNGATALLLFVYYNADLETLLSGIQVEYIALQFVVEGNAASFYENLSRYLSSKNIDVARLNMAINTDPVESLLRTGNWRSSEDADREELNKVLALHHKVVINSNSYHNAGAPAAYEIACTLAHANTYLGWINDTGITFHLNVAVGPDYFFEIAKLRALRKTFALLLAEYNNHSPVYIHAETAFRNLTVFDIHNNLLRTTTAAMAATTAGCNSLVVKPFDITCKEENEFSDRLARNIQLILKSESYFDKVADVSAGSFFIEELTEQIAEKAWEYFVEIEKEGGFVHALKSGTVQQRIKDFASLQQQRFNEGKEILVGTNKFPDLKESKKDIAGNISWGSTGKQGKEIETLATQRLAAINEKERLND
jgi:methylmalonyl-CoA mutase